MTEPDPNPSRTGRGERLAESVAEAGLDLLLVTDLVNVRWLTGFTGTNGACLCGPGRSIFLTDFRYTEVAEGTLVGWRVETVRGDWQKGLAGRIGELAGGDRLKVGYEDDHLTVRSLRRLTGALGDSDGREPEDGEQPGDAAADSDPGAVAAVELVAAGGMVEKLRRGKDERELEAIAAAARFADRIYEATVERGFKGRAEIEVARFALARMREQGAEPSFPPIVAAGPNGALPHAVPGERLIEEGDLVVFDMGVELDGVCSDCTRTYAVGDLDDESRAVYETVLAAQEKALAAIRAGTSGKEIDGVARSVIEAAGYGEYFGHGLGHGVGLEVHEAPRLSPLSQDTLIENDVVTVEPGIYLPGRLGVRIEDLVVVTADGHRNLSALPK